MRKTSQAYNSSQSPCYMKTKSICYVRGLSWRRLVETNSICPETLNYVRQNKQAEIDAWRFELFSLTGKWAEWIYRTKTSAVARVV